MMLHGLTKYGSKPNQCINLMAKNMIEGLVQGHHICVDFDVTYKIPHWSHMLILTKDISYLKSPGFMKLYFLGAITTS
jgi:hypothetical protein